MEYDASAEKDEFYKIQMEQFTVQAEETIEAQRNLYLQEAGEEVRRREESHGKLVKSRTNCRNSTWSLHLKIQLVK